jgi:beta-glucosidase
MTLEARYKDTSLSNHDRAEALLAEMTVKEKVAQIGAIWVSDLITPSRKLVVEAAEEKISHGIGHITRIGAVGMVDPVPSATLANSIQKFLVEQTRLGIPAIVHEESCAGYTAKQATSFPQAIGLASTWEPELVTQMTAIIRKQMRAVGAHHTLAPVLDVVRDARWGRLEETFGEDPYLIGRMGSAYIQGIQGDNWNEGIVATAKHFLGYAMSEGGLNWAPAHIPERELRDMILYPFIVAIQEAKIGSVMNSYQELDGVPVGSSKEYMVDLLRGELGFEGVVASDYFTLDMFQAYHHIAKDKSEAAKYGLEAEIDVELPASDCYGQPLLDALEAGDIDINLVETCALRVLEMKVQLGLLENPYVDTDAIPAIYSDKSGVELSRKIAEQSIVLLKNDNNLLPLTADVSTVAVIGPHADSARLLQADYHYPSHLEGIFGGNDDMDAPAPDGEASTEINWDDHRPPTTTILQGAHAALTHPPEIMYVKGCEVTGNDKSGFAQAVQAAQTADVVVLTVGDISGLGAEHTVGETRDSATLRLPGVQQDLIEAVHATGKPIVLVLVTGRPYALEWHHENIPAIVEAWLPAEQGGTAIADVLYGNVNPGGKLTITFPRHVGQIPTYYNHKPSGQRSHWYVDYTDLAVKPLYPFGHGLSYTTFEYSNLTISDAEVAPDGTVQISCEVKNTGDRAGDEIVQLYLQDVIGSVTRPVKELKGFKRISLDAGQSAKVTFEVNAQQMAFHNRDMQYVVEPGDINVMMGASSEDIRLDGKFTIVGETTPASYVFESRVTIQ